MPPHALSATLRQTRIRVLPVRSLGGGGSRILDGAEGLGDEILVQLTAASPSEVAVVATPLASWRVPFEPEVPVDFLLAAAVGTAGDRLRVTSKLIDARSLRHVWVGRFEAPLDRHVDAHVSVALRIVREVIAKLGHDTTDRLDRTEGDVSGRAVPSRTGPRARIA